MANPPSQTTIKVGLASSLPDAASAPSSASLSMYESPSPPTSTSSKEYMYGSVMCRQTDSAVVQLPADRDRPISPIPLSQPSDPMWEGSSFIPVVPDETTRLVEGSDSGSDLLSRSRADLERARMASSTYPFDPEGMKDRCILGCTILALTAVVFVVIVSGMTTMLANRNFPQLEVFSDWPNGGIIPRQYGCHAEDGKPQSIPLHWRNVPRSATNLAILFAHPGSLSENGFDPVHWFVTDVPLNTGGKSSITANASANPALMPVGAKQYRSAYSTRTGYWPPCVQNGTSLFAVHIYAIDASPTIGNFRDAREIMNRFVGVPVARITGVYGEPSPLHIPTGKGQTGWNPDDDDDDGGASQNGDLSNNSDGKDGHESGHGDHGHNSDEKNGHEPGHIHGVHNGDGKEIHEPGHVHGEPGHNDGKGGHEHEHSDGGSTSKGDHGHTVDKDHSAEHQEHEGAGDGHKSAEDGHEENGDGSKEDHAEENTDGAQEEKTTDKKSPTTENAS